MTTPLSDERVVAMRARIEAVESSYPGEWGSWWAPDACEGAVIANPIPTFDPWTGERDEDEQLFLVYDIPDDESAQALLAFAQHAKVDMSDLLAEVDRLRARVARLGGVLRSVDDALVKNKDICPLCQAYPPTHGYPHYDDCELAAALGEATDAE